MTAKEIKDKYKKKHDKLTEDYYQKHELTKEDFALQHGEIWADMEAELIAEGYLKPPEPARDFKAEIDDLKERIKKLENKRGG